MVWLAGGLTNRRFGQVERSAAAVERERSLPQAAEEAASVRTEADNRQV